MASEIIFKPVDEFDRLKSSFNDASHEYFDELVKKSNIDIEANRTHVKLYNQQNFKVNQITSKLKNFKNTKTFLIVISIISLIASFFLALIPILFDKVMQYWYCLLIAIFLFCSAIISLVLVKTKFKKAISSKESQLNSERKILSDRLQTCYNDLYPLNSLFEWNMASDISNKICPLFNFDRYLNNHRLIDLTNNFNLNRYNDIDSSIVKILSGDLSGNPFVLIKTFNRKMSTKVYSGSIVITWTTTETDSNGNTHFRSHTQTLTASISKPCPYYSTLTKLHYGNEAASKLTFSRLPQHGDELSLKQREKTIKNVMKDIHKKAEKQIKTGSGSFTPMGNDAFDVFFRATNRNNEVEFRLLFTPLAQQNILSLILNKYPYGDDFVFDKYGPLNTIISTHNQDFDFNAAPSFFTGYDFDKIKNNFINYTNEFFQSIYYSFAPILSIPIYQTHKAYSSIYVNDNPDKSISRFEKEVMANKLDADYFRPLKADKHEPVMIKFDTQNKNKNYDSVHFVTSSYEKIKRVEVVSKMGGDGHMHAIPIDYFEYKEVNGDGDLIITDLDCSYSQFRSLKKSLSIDFDNTDYYFERGMLSIANKNKNASLEMINSLFKKSND